MEAARAKVTALAEALSERRRKAAHTLGRRIDETLRDLGLREASVTVVVEDREEPGPRGRDRVRFSFAPNPGEEARPLARIASGGELSRVMLAVKRALAQSDRALTYVFDEVDTGVGGGTAEVIGRKLKAIAADRQVLAVTHLPQIAAFADQHIRVEKHTSGGRTSVRVAVARRARARGRDRPHARRRQALARGRRPRRRDAPPSPRDHRRRVSPPLPGPRGLVVQSPVVRSPVVRSPVVRSPLPLGGARRERSARLRAG